MSIRPLRNLLYILPLEDPVQIGHIVRPDTHTQKIDQGIVKYRGPLTSGEIQIGDHVGFSSWAGDKAIIEGEGPLFIMPEDTIDFVYTEDESIQLLSIPQLKAAVTRAAAEIARISQSNEEKTLVISIAERVNEHMDSRFFEELHF